jgi:predicted MFS family arabinose efflux permease
VTSENSSSGMASPAGGGARDAACGESGRLRRLVRCYAEVGRHRAFRRFWLGMMISRAGDAFTVVALAWVVLDIAGPVQLGIVLMCFGLPRIVTGPVAGRALDRWDPRLLLAADNAARGLLIAVVPVLLWLHHLAVADLYGIAVVSAALSAVTEVAEGALVPRLIGAEHLEGANSLLAANWELSAIAGPVLSGLTVATVGAGLALVLDAVSFAVMAALCLSLPAFRPGPPAPVSSGAGRNWLGLGVLFRFPAVVVLTVCSCGMLCLDGVATVLYPVYCRTFLHVSAVGYGLLVAAAGIGALLGVVWGAGSSGRRAPALRIAGVIACGAPLFGLLRFAPDLPVAALLLGLACFSWGPYFALDRTLVQRLVPDDVRSRLVGARMTISSLGFPLGSAIGGALIGAIGVPILILAIAGAYLALGSLPLLATGLRSVPAPRALARARQSAG